MLENYDKIIFMTAYSHHKQKLKKNKKFPKLKDFNTTEYKIHAFVVEDLAFYGDIKTKIEVDISDENPSSYKILSPSKYETREDIMFLVQTSVTFNISRNRICKDSMQGPIMFILFEPLFIEVKNTKYEINSLVYYVNGTFIVTYEIYNISDQCYFSKEDLIENDNFGLLLLDAYKFKSDESYNYNKQRISEIIYKQCLRLITELLGSDFGGNYYTYLNNKLIYTKHLEDAVQYVNNVMKVKNVIKNLENLNNDGNFKYYSTDLMALVVHEETSCFHIFPIEIEILEIMKLLINLELIHAYSTEQTLLSTMQRYNNLQHYLYQTDAPIITLNLLNNIQESNYFKLRLKQLNWKIQYLQSQSEQKKEKNVLILNFLLYILAFIGSISTLEIISFHFSISFKFLLATTVSIFSFFGIFWLLNERKINQK